jgi:5-hydroxyisourate hydrolase
MSTVSSHVLDTALGRPASGMRARLQMLEAVDESQHWKTLGEQTTDDDGRIRHFVQTPIGAGVYRVCFDTKTYFEASGHPVFYPQVEVVFAVEGTGDDHYHVPLLLSPFGYSTYRGS